MATVKKYRLTIEVTVEEISDSQIQESPDIQELKDYIDSLDPETNTKDILVSEIWNQFYQSLDPHTRQSYTYAILGLVRNGYDTIAEVKTLNLPLLWTFRHYGEKRINFISQIFDIR